MPSRLIPIAIRTLEKGSEHCTLTLLGTQVGISGSSFTEEEVAMTRQEDLTEDEAIRLFQRMVRQREEQGFVETEHSRSRRVFEEMSEPPGRYWMIEIWEGKQVLVESGSFPDPLWRWHVDPKKKRKSKKLRTAEAAREWYAAEIDDRVAEGYVEVLPRETEFSSLGGMVVNAPSDYVPLDAPDPRMVSWVESRRQPAWRPVVEDGEGAPAGSRFAGGAWLAEGETWPRCGRCGAPLQLFLQLDLAGLPEDAPGQGQQGLLQLFYCTREEGACEDGDPFGPNRLARVVQPSGAGVREPAGKSEYPPKRIAGWERFEDYPGSEEYPDLGFWEALGWPLEQIAEAEEEGEYPDLELGEQFPPLAGDKLGGWPLWQQDSRHPGCPECGARMEYFFQLDAGENLPFRFGDNGTGHLFRCPAHAEVLAFSYEHG